MVDPVSGSGGAQNSGAVNRSQKNQIEKQAEVIGASRDSDRVELSDEAISLADAEATAKATRTILEERVEETLSSDANRIDTLL